MSIGANLAAKHLRRSGKVLRVLRVIGTSASKVFAVGRRGKYFTFRVSLRVSDIFFVFMFVLNSLGWACSGVPLPGWDRLRHGTGTCDIANSE